MAGCLVDFFTTLVVLLRKSEWADDADMMAAKSMVAVRAAVRDACARLDGLSEALARIPARMALQEDEAEVDAMRAWLGTFGLGTATATMATTATTTRLAVRGQDS
jgi:hypothetical protein